MNDGTQIDCLIDGQNRRIGKRVNGTLVQAFTYQDQLNIAAEYDGTGTLVARLQYGSVSHAPDSLLKAGVEHRVVADHLGSPRLIMSSLDGTVVQRLDYDEFGMVLADSNPGFQPLTFAGGIGDSDSGLVRFGARDYDSSTGRWTAKDPTRFSGGLNLFGYSLNDPVNFVDREGEVPLLALAAIPFAGAAAGLASQVISNAANGCPLLTGAGRAAAAGAAGAIAGAAVAAGVTATGGGAVGVGLVSGIVAIQAAGASSGGAGSTSNGSLIGTFGGAALGAALVASPPAGVGAAAGAAAGAAVGGVLGTTGGVVGSLFSPPPSSPCGCQ